MPGRQLRVVTDDPQAEAAAWLHHAPDNVLVCRGQGHNWPRVKPGTNPRGIKGIPQRDGSYQVTWTCPDCKKTRTLTTRPGGQIDLPAKYTYVTPAGFKAPKGVRVTRRDCFAETWRRVLEQGQLVASPSPSGVPEIEFRSS